MADDWKDRVNISASAVQLLQAFGLWELICAGLLSIAQAVVAIVTGAPPLLVPTLAAVMLAAVLVAFNQLGSIRQRQEQKIRQGKPDYAAWDDFTEFRLWEAACLWDDKPVTSRVLTENGLAIFRRMKREIAGGRMGYVDLRGKDANRGTIVSRDHLRELARKWGERPPFLFPEERGKR